MSPLKRAAILAIGGFITLSPALPHLFDIGHGYIRFYSMFTGVGAGLLKGEFTIVHANGTTETATPLQVLGLDAYPRTEHHYTFDRRVLSEDAVSEIAADFCAARVPEGARLDYAGKVGVIDGWATHEARDICRAPTRQIAEASDA